MRRRPSQTFGSGGSTQAERWPRALDPDYSRLDDRSLVDLLDRACRFASLIQFYGPDNRAAGDWLEVLAADPIVTLASIVATDIRQAEQRLSALEHRVRTARRAAVKRARLVAFWEMLLDVPRQIDRWQRGLALQERSALGLEWRTTIDTAVDDVLRPVVRQLKAYDLGAALPGAPGTPLGIDYGGFSARWRLDDVEADGSLYIGESEGERIDRFLPHVFPLWRPIAHAVSGWAAAAKPQLERALDRPGVVRPHIGLLIAFCRLFESAQQSMNAVAARRTDFYYREVLREQHRPAVADAVHVAFEPSPAREPLSVLVPAGTRLAAGKDAAGRDLVYESVEPVVVTSAALARVMTVCVTAGPLTAASTATVPQRVLARALAPGGWESDTWAAFGAATDEPAELGFAVTSPALRLTGGERTIRLDIRHAPHAPASLSALQAIGQQTGLSGAHVLAQVLTQAFTLTVSTPGGWAAVERYDVPASQDRRATAFSLRFTWSPHAPAVANFAGALPGTTEPAVRAHLRQQPMAILGPTGRVLVYPLSVLHALRVTDVRVHVVVKDLPHLRIFNPEGLVDSSKPFAALGAVPTVGSAMRVKHDELFAKRVESLALRMKWFDLPLNRTGLRGYYRQYVVDPDGAIRDSLFDNQSFRVAVSVEHAGRWTTAADPGTEEPYLFRSAGRPDDVPDPDTALAQVTTLAISAMGLPAPPSGYQPADGALRIELRRPAYGFGHSLFAPNTLHAMLSGSAAGGNEAGCRAAYSEIADVRRRLDDLLEAGGFRRADRLVNVLSPAPWPRRAGQQLVTTYRDLTDAWRAYLHRRPGIDASSSWIVRNQETGPDDLDATVPGDPSYRRTVRATVRATVRSLLDVASGCLAESVASVQDQADANEWRTWQQRLAAAGQGTQAQQLTGLRALHTQLAAVAADGGSSPAMTRCQAMLLAASMVHDCDPQADHLDYRYAMSVRANLRTCIGRLQSLYDSSVLQCIADRRTARQMPNTPYLPQIDGLALDYTASASAEFVHLLPFGGSRPQALSGGEPPTLVPQFANAGALFVGVSGLVTPQTLRLYVRLGPGDAHDTPEVGWEYLQGDRWLRLPAPHGDADTTEGLRTSGTISLSIPPIAPESSSMLPSELHWLRAVVRERPEAFSELTGVMLHAVSAVRHVVEPGDDLDRPLPARGIAGLLRPLKGIRGVSQPAPSYGGRAPESDRAFHTRVSERLRHKGRAVVGWDYERLVLERFPMIWQARALPARRRRVGDAGTGAGHVRILVVAGPSCPEITDAAAPLASRDRLADIERSLRAAAGPAVSIHACNPVFVRVRVSATVQWRQGLDPHQGAALLNTALDLYLSPWQQAVHDHTYWSEAAIGQFVRARPEVASLLSIAFHYESDDAGVTDHDLRMLTSAGAHQIHAASLAPMAIADGY